MWGQEVPRDDVSNLLPGCGVLRADQILQQRGWGCGVCISWGPRHRRLYQAWWLQSRKLQLNSPTIALLPADVRKKQFIYHSDSIGFCSHFSPPPSPEQPRLVGCCAVLQLAALHSLLMAWYLPFSSLTGTVCSLSASSVTSSSVFTPLAMNSRT